MMQVTTNAPEEQLRDASKHKSIVDAFCAFYGFSEQNVCLVINSGAHVWRHGTNDLMFVIDVLVPDSFLTEDMVSKSVEMLTKAFQENFPGVRKERVLISYRTHDIKLMGVNGETIDSYMTGKQW